MQNHRCIIPCTGWYEWTKQCAAYHHRMPVIIDKSEMGYWFNASTDELAALYTINQSFDTTE
ncbi:SOS response-associated peptidase [Catenovulum sediminis]|uniref:SOS response-associated peptidase n=1 Tax=Catenovulum sediminis TaxID=1740262 RepID=UPI001FE3ABB3|nr:SOS response-associated peptidase [Catenovulum sediminis]